MYEKREQTTISWFKQLKLWFTARSSYLTSRQYCSSPIHRFHYWTNKGITGAIHVRFLTWISNTCITILMAQLILSVSTPTPLPPSHLSGTLSVPAEGNLSENVFPARRGAFVNSSRSGNRLLEAVNVVHFFTVMLNLAEKKFTFFSAPPVGVLYEPPGPTVGHLQPFQEKMTNARQMPRGDGQAWNRPIPIY